MEIINCTLSFFFFTSNRQKQIKENDYDTINHPTD
jgi:hypothetical protein